MRDWDRDLYRRPLESATACGGDGSAPTALGNMGIAELISDACGQACRLPIRSLFEVCNDPSCLALRPHSGGLLKPFIEAESGVSG